MPKLLIHSWFTVIPPKPNTIGEFSFSAANATASKEYKSQASK